MPKKIFPLLLAAAMWAASEMTETREVPTTADVVRFLEQATWGPTPDLIAHVQEVGFETFLEEQFSAEVSGYPNMELVPADRDAITCPNGSPCQRDNYTLYPLQTRFFTNALHRPDQLRQRVAFALHQILVVSGIEVRLPGWMFSHADQIAQWQTAIADRIEQTGWGGRCAEQFSAHATGFPTVTALSGGIFGRGPTTTPLSIASAPTPLDRLFVLNGFSDTPVDDARRSSMEFLRTIDTDATLVAAASGTTGQAVQIGRIMSTDVTVATEFPDTPLGNQLKQVAKMIGFNTMLAERGLKRQIFFCQLGGFDTHQGQLATHGSLLAQLSTALDAFYRETVRLRLDRNITTFTLSDFGRTLQPAGFGATVGSDHAWGNHHLVLGGAVDGGDFYGVSGPSGTVFPLLKLGGQSDADDRGRWIPTASVEQYAATLALWFGVAPGNLSVVFPNIGRFETPTLGFIP